MVTQHQNWDYHACFCSPGLMPAVLRRHSTMCALFIYWPRDTKVRAEGWTHKGISGLEGLVSSRSPESRFLTPPCNCQLMLVSTQTCAARKLPIKSRLCTKHHPIRFPKGKTVEEKSSKGVVMMEMDLLWHKRWIWRGNGQRLNPSSAGTPLAPHSGFHLLLTDVCVGLLPLTGNPSCAPLTNKNEVNVTGSTAKKMLSNRGSELEIKHPVSYSPQVMFSAEIIIKKPQCFLAEVTSCFVYHYLIRSTSAMST